MRDGEVRLTRPERSGRIDGTVILNALRALRG
jgi:hypothetical protein